jgi:L-ascorbate metabolism protein UlaG (beta-lactamase superfamily)
MKIKWLGHSAFHIETAKAKILIDPFFTGNPAFREAERKAATAGLTHILLTHGHGDHVGDTVALAQRHSCAVVAQVELRGWLAGQGVAEDARHAINKGGTIDVDGVKVTLTNAFHSSSTPDGTYAGEACGIVLGLESGFRIYFAGDTCVFGDMSLIARLHQPDLVVLPIGDHFTMGAHEAAVALELLGAKRCVPCHYGTFPLLTGTPEQLRGLAPDVEIEAPAPGGTVEL